MKKIHKVKDIIKILWNKKTNKSYLTTPKEICHEKYLYESKLTDDYFSNPNALENKFSKMEGQWATLIERIIKTCDNKNCIDEITSNRRELEELFCNLFLRNPYNLNSLSNFVEKMGWHDELHFFANHGIGEDKHIGMGVRIDEAGCDILAGGIDLQWGADAL